MSEPKFNYIEITAGEGSQTIEANITQARAVELAQDIQQFNDAHAPARYRMIKGI